MQTRKNKVLSEVKEEVQLLEVVAVVVVVVEAEGWPGRDGGGRRGCRARGCPHTVR